MKSFVHVILNNVIENGTPSNIYELKKHNWKYIKTYHNLSEADKAGIYTYLDIALYRVYECSKCKIRIGIINHINKNYKLVGIRGSAGYYSYGCDEMIMNGALE